MENNNTDPNLTEGEPNTSEQSTRTINKQTTTSERMERSKYKFPILSDRETDLTKINPKMWWEQISEYIHLTYNRNLEEITDESVRTMDPHTVYHKKGDVIWALGPKAKHEIMRGQRGRELKDVNLPELLTLFKKTFLPVRNVFHSRAQFFNMKQEDNETLDEYWKRLVDTERKCDFGNITAEEIITYKFAATIKDKRARDKFIKVPLKIQLVLDMIELNNYNRKYGNKKPKNKKARKGSSNSSTSTELVGHTNQPRKRKTNFIEKKKFPNRDCRFCGKSNWSMEHICPARKAQCNNCKKMGHFTKVCKSKTVSRIKEATSSDTSTDPWPEIDHIQFVKGVNRVDFYKTILLVHGHSKEFIIDTGSPVTNLPSIITPEEIKKTTKIFVDVNKNLIKFKGEAMVEAKTEKSKEILPILITENKSTQPLLGLDWLGKLKLGYVVEEDERRKKIISEHEDLFKNNHTIKDLTIDIQLKKDVKPIQQKGRPVPIHFQKSVREELEKLIDSGHLEKADNTTENCFISPAVITIKKDSRKFNEACITRKAAMLNMEELISKISAKITKGEGEGEIWMSKIDLDYAYGQQNCPRKQQNTVCFRLSAEILPDTIASRRIFTDYQISLRCSRNTLTTN